MLPSTCYLSPTRLCRNCVPKPSRRRREQEELQEQEEDEDTLEFTPLQMQAIIDMSVEHYAKSQGASVDVFNVVAERLKQLYHDRQDVLFSKRQARKLMELTSIRCTKVVPPCISEKP